jgi:hypothetical protein
MLLYSFVEIIMAITVGTDTYISLADARAYTAENGLTALPTVDADAETLLKRSTKALDQIYGAKYLGMKETIQQSLAWPRLFLQGTISPHGVNEWPYIITDSDGNPRDFSITPVEVSYAEVELASMLQAGTDIYAQPQAAVNFDRSVVGTLEKEFRTTDNKSYRVDPLYKISLILRPLLINSNGAILATRGA